MKPYIFEKIHIKVGVGFRKWTKKMSKIENLKIVSQKTLFFDHCDYYDVNCLLLLKKSVTIFFL